MPVPRANPLHRLGSLLVAVGQKLQATSPEYAPLDNEACA
jgi:hypothetical protein